MKRFQFDDLWIMSKKERRAVSLHFHPRRNLIVGSNHTGKSTLIKSLFITLGATPTGELGKWDKSAASAVRFSVDGVQFRAVHDSGRRGLFDKEGNLLGTASKATEWVKIFSDAVGFNLILTNAKEGHEAQADVSSYFLPFYIDQDSGWVGSWDVFRSTKQFKAPVGPILEYFSGIKPPEYYRAKALYDEIKLKLSNLNRELVFLNKAQARFNARLPVAAPKMESENFTNEVAHLSQEMSLLNASQEKLRQKAAQESDLVARLTRQIDVAETVLAEYGRDTKYMRARPDEPLVCPVCQAEHQEPYLDLLAFADDARSLRSMILDFKEDRTKWIESLKQTREQIRGLDESYEKIEAILAVRRGELEFRQIVESRGAEQAFQAFVQERAAFEAEMGTLQVSQSTHKEEMDKWTDRKRTTNIVSNFKSAYAAALHDLNMPAAKISGLSGRPTVSGSGGPRAILAYYSALWSICLGPTGAFGNPIVVDSPNQQGQDGENLPMVLQYVSLKLPGDGQVILGSEVEVEYEFDKRFSLNRAYQVLDENEFDAASAQFDDLLVKMYLGMS